MNDFETCHHQEKLKFKWLTNWKKKKTIQTSKKKMTKKERKNVRSVHFSYQNHGSVILLSYIQNVYPKKP